MTFPLIRVLALSSLLVGAGAQAKFQFSTPGAVLSSGPQFQLAAVPAPNAAQLLVIDLSGKQSIDGPGDADNQRLSFLIGAGAVVVGMGWDLRLSTVGASWLSEATVNFNDAVNLRPGQGDDFGGTNEAYSSGGLVDLIAAGLSFSVGADGQLKLELMEISAFSDDNANAADALYLAGSTVTVAYVSAIPEPASFGLLALGLAGLRLARRRAA